MTQKETRPPHEVSAKREEAGRSADERILQALRLLWKEGEVRELRVIGAVTPHDARPHVESGYFDNPEDLFAAAKRYEGEGCNYEGICLTLNPVTRSSTAGRLGKMTARPKRTTGDSASARRRFLLIDIDPVKAEPNASATKTEKRRAFEVAKAVRNGLRDLGWQDPLILDSGNGVHLLYAIDLPADDGGLCERVLKGLDAAFSDDGASVDTSTSNASRLMKVPGTEARKGDNTEERPWRRSKPLKPIPDALQPVPEDLLRQVAGWAPENLWSHKSLLSHSESIASVDAWIEKHGLVVSKSGKWREDGFRWELEECPLKASHRRKAVIVVRGNGQVGAMCQKARCPLSWRRLQEKYPGGMGGMRRMIQDTKWPEPLSEAAFHGLAGEIVRLVEPHSEADPAGLLTELLGAVGSAVGRGAYLMVGSDRHHVNLFLVLVGKTAKSRKGTSWGVIRALMEKVDPDWLAKCVSPGLTSGEGIIWAVRDRIIKKEPVRKTDHRVSEYQDVVSDHGVEDKRLLAQEAEYVALLRVMRREGNTLSAVIRDSWDTGNLRTLAKRAPAKATGAHVSIIGHITQEELLRYLDDTEAANGFGNRFLWICVKRSKMLPHGGQIPPDRLKPLLDRLKNALKFSGSVGQLRWSKEAEGLWEKEYKRLSAGSPGLFGSMTARAEAQVIRLASIYALLDESKIINPPHLHAALAVWSYAEDSARYLFGNSVGDPVADHILQALREAPDGLTRTKIRDLLQRHGKQNRIEQALKLLESTGRARPEPTKTGGRPAERWHATAT